MIYQRSCNQKKARVAILISDKIDLMTQNMTTDKKENFIMIKESIHITHYNNYIWDTTQNYINQNLTELKREIENNNLYPEISKFPLYN